jgi:hypothetical protein
LRSLIGAPISSDKILISGLRDKDMENHQAASLRADRKRRLLQGIESLANLRLCGPSDDPEEQTSVTESYRYLLTQIKMLAAGIVPREVQLQLESLSDEIESIYDVYRSKASLDSIAADIMIVLESGEAEAMSARSALERVRDLILAQCTGSYSQPNSTEAKEYVQLRAQLRSDEEFRSRLPQIVAESPDLASAYGWMKQFGSYAERRKFLGQEFEKMFDAIDTESPKGKVFAAGSTHDAYKEIRKIFQSVQKAILVVDNYVDETLWTVLATCPKGIDVRVMTSKAKADFGLEGKKFATQHQASVKIRHIKDIHDRFIVVDDRVWHLGCSIKDAGNKVFFLSEMQDKSLRDATRTILENQWAKASLP